MRERAQDVRQISDVLRGARKLVKFLIVAAAFAFSIHFKVSKTRNRWRTSVILRWAVLFTAVDSWMVCRISCKPAAFGDQGAIVACKSCRFVMVFQQQMSRKVGRKEGRWGDESKEGLNSSHCKAIILCASVDRPSLIRSHAPFFTPKCHCQHRIPILQ